MTVRRSALPFGEDTGRRAHGAGVVVVCANAIVANENDAKAMMRRNFCMGRGRRIYNNCAKHHLEKHILEDSVAHSD